MSDQADILIRFGRRVRQLRERKRLSQEDLGLEAGLDRTYISGIERGVRNVSLKNIAAIAEALNVTLAEMFESLG
jgi:transcriptional regulator with XRE-family HTH domain